MADIFISYAREDIKKAELLAAALESKGWSVFWDRTSLFEGQDFEAVIEQAIQQADCIIVAWSQASKQSDWVFREASIGRQRKLLVPMLFEVVDPPIAFQSLPTENLASWEGDTDGPDFLKLCQAINARIKPEITFDTNIANSNEPENQATNSVKHFSFKQFLRNIWKWLSITKHQQTLTLIGGGLMIAIAGAWQGYLHFSKQPIEYRPIVSALANGIASLGNITTTASNAGNAIVTTGDVKIGMSDVSVEAIVNTLTNKYQFDTQAKDEQITALTEAVTALSKGQNIYGTEAQVKIALEKLAKGDTTQAKALFANAAQKVDQDTIQGAQAYRNLGALAYLNNTQEALQAYRRATELDPNNAVGWNKLGLLLKRVGDFEGAITAFDKVMALGEEHRDQQELAWSYGSLGNVYQIRGDLDKSLEYHQKALTVNQGLGNKNGMAGAYGNLGIVYDTRSDLNKAFEYYQKSLTLYESLDNKEGMTTQYGNLGNIYLSRGEMDRALGYYHKALNFNESLGHKEGMAIQYGNIGNAYDARGDFEAAIKYQKKALMIDEGLGNKEGIAADYGNLANAYDTLGDLGKAVEYFQKSLALYESLGNKEGMAIQYGNLGLTYEKQGQREQAIWVYQKSIDLFKAFGNPSKIKEIQDRLDAL
jgi:protein O-GlcNAc transferase